MRNIEKAMDVVKRKYYISKIFDVQEDSFKVIVGEEEYKVVIEANNLVLYEKNGLVIDKKPLDTTIYLYSTAEERIISDDQKEEQIYTVEPKVPSERLKNFELLKKACSKFYNNLNEAEKKALYELGSLDARTVSAVIGIIEKAQEGSL